ncbi:MAG: zf-HC2 domain-containing protein [Microlunatus sp.]|nr:zf-HC2 domain-containing protein [Microlunatus sp.]
MNQSDPYGDWDAAYVLGALTVQQRHEFEDHLAECPDCRQAVGDLAAMPGLLAQLPAAEAIALSDQSDSPDAAPMPDSIRDLSLPRRLGTRARMLLAAAVALVLIMGGIGGYVVHNAVDAYPGNTTSELVAFAPEHPTSLIANAKLTASGPSTKIYFDCVYALNGGYDHPVRFALQTVDDQGRTQRLWHWAAGPGDRRTWPGESPLPLHRIRSLQIVLADTGSVVMTAAVR